MCSTSLSRHSATVVQKPSGVTARLLSSTPGRVKIGSVGTFAGLEIPARPAPPAAKNDSRMNGYARRLDKYKAGQAPTTMHPDRTRTIKPGLSWLGDDEFESAGLAFKLARHHMRRVDAKRSTGDPHYNKTTNGERNSSSGFRRNDRETPRRVRVSNNAEKDISQHKRDPAQHPRPKPKQADPPIAGPPKSATLRPAPKPSAKPSLKPSPTPQTPTHIDFGSTDFTSLFGAPSLLSDVPSSTGAKTTGPDAVSRRVQLALENQGGDYSKLIPKPFATGRVDALTYAASTIARRRDLGPNGRNNALEIVRGMVGKSLGSRPTL